MVWLKFNAWNVSKVWYLVIVDLFLNSLFKCSIIASTSFCLVRSSWSISVMVSIALSSRGNTNAEPCLFSCKSIKRLFTLMSLTQSTYVFHFHRDGGFGAIWCHNYTLNNHWSYYFVVLDFQIRGWWIFIFTMLPLIN